LCSLLRSFFRAQSEHSWTQKFNFWQKNLL